MTPGLEGEVSSKRGMSASQLRAPRRQGRRGEGEEDRRARRIDVHPSQDRKADVDPEVSEDPDLEEDWERWKDAVRADGERRRREEGGKGGAGVISLSGGRERERAEVKLEGWRASLPCIET